MKAFGYVLVVIAGCWVSLMSTPAQAETLRVQPLEYHTTLATSDIQKGFIDITNPSGTAVTVSISVQAFRQVDDSGTIEFYTSEVVSAGIKPDLDEFELGAKEAIRMYFLVDGAKLPSGDVFAALFATAQTKGDGAKSGVEQAVRVGTLLNIVNGTPGPRDADVVQLSVPFFQIGDKITGTYVIKNRAAINQATGFYPEVTAAIEPFRAQHNMTAKLVFAGRSRTNNFAFNEARLGFYKISVTYKDSSKSQWIFVATGIWQWAGLILLVISVVGMVAGIVYVRRRHKVKFRQ